MPPNIGRVVQEASIYEGRRKLDELRAKRKTCYDLGQALLDIDPPASIRTWVGRSDQVGTSIHRLSPVPGLPKLREMVAERRQSQFRRPITERNVIITAGANAAFSVALFALTKPGDQVVLLSPYFFNHLGAVNNAALYPVILDCAHKEGFKIPRAALAESVAKGAKIIALTNPSNPIGEAMSAEDHEAIDVIAAHCTKIVDESYYRFIPEAGSWSSPSYDVERMVIIGSFSKSLAISGWRVGYAIAEEEVVEQMIRVQDHLMISASSAAQQIVLEILKDEETFIRTIVRPELSMRREILVRALSEAEAVEAIYGDSALYIFVKLRPILDVPKLCERLLDRGIFIVSGSVFGVGGRSCVRIAYGQIAGQQLEVAARIIVEEIRGCR